MGSPSSLVDLIGAYGVGDFSIPANGNDAGVEINRALSFLASRAASGATLYLAPGTYTIRTPIVHPSNVEVIGAGSVTVLQLGADANVDVWTATDVSNIRIRNLRINGNRANNTSGTRQGLWLYRVTDAWIENVEVVSCRTDGFRLDDCERVELIGCKASDNGRHGMSISYSRYCQVVSPRCYDNSQVSSAGVGDGINLELVASENTIVCPICYETALVGDRQGYGVREAAGENCTRNLVIGGALRGNRSGAIILDSGDSAALTNALMQIPAGLRIEP